MVRLWGDTRRGERRRRLAAIALGVTAAVAVAAPRPAPAADPSAPALPPAVDARLRCPGRASVVGGTIGSDIWVRLRGPVFGSPPGPGIPTVRAHAVAPHDPRLLYASDGHSVHRSNDAGCTWQEVLRAGGTPLIVDSEVVLSNPRPVSALAVPSHPDAHRTVFALAAGGSGRLAPYRPQVLVSRDAGATWSDASAGLPVVAINPCDRCREPTASLHLAPSDPGVAYLVLDVDAGAAPGLLYATADGGATWERRDVPAAAPVPVGAGGDATSVAVDPAHAGTLWVLAGGLHHSSDGGRTWSETPVHLNRPTGLDVAAVPGRPARVLVLDRDDDGDPGRVTHVVRSTDGGHTFTRSPAGTDAMRGHITVRTGITAGDVVVTAAELAPDGDIGRAFRWDPATARFAPLGAPPRSLVDGQPDRTGLPWRWYRSGGDLVAAGPLPELEGGPGGEPVLPGLDLRAAAPTAERSAAFAPADVALTMSPGGERIVTHVLDLPPRPTPVDVWFLVDTSSSQSRAIDGLRSGIQQIVEELAASEIDAWFGLAEYKNEARAYARLADVAPPGADLASALADLRASDGGEETQYVALQQTATGGGDPRFDIAPGLGASFRDGALKVIVHATDEAFGVHDDGPSAADAVAALQAKGIRHVGLAVGVDGRPSPSQSDLVAQLDHLALHTGAVATDEGVDCDGDGHAEVLPGRPITCAVAAHGAEQLNLVPSIVSAVRAVRRDAPFGIGFAGVGDGVTAAVAGPLPPLVDVARHHSLPVTVRYACAARTAGGRPAVVRVDAVVGGAVVATAAAAVTCVAPPARPPAAAPGPPLPIAPTAPAHPVPQVEPAPTGASAPAGAAQPSAQGALAAQPSEVQTVTARAYDGRGRDAVPGPVVPIAAGAALAAATAAVLHRPQVRHQRARRR